ncbi:MAG TPA: hypothetical protein VGD05_07055 [Pyrinomonadaceae bacterium]|jgi:hypothetical protein
MNEPLLRKTANAIAANPEYLDMNDYVGRYNGRTTACIAGLVLFTHEKQTDLTRFYNKYRDRFPVDETRKLLGLNDVEFGELTIIQLWLESDAKTAYLNAQTPEEQALAAAEYIRWFVKTGGGTK